MREQEDSIRQGMEEDWWNDWEHEQEQAYDEDDAERDAREVLMDVRPADERGATFEDYVVPGGINDSYREAFLTAPAPQLTAAEPAAANLAETVIWPDGHDDYWMIENPIVRVRYDFRHDTNGNYLLFVHEIQPPQPEHRSSRRPCSSRTGGSSALGTRSRPPSRRRRRRRLAPGKCRSTLRRRAGGAEHHLDDEATGQN